MNRNTWIAITVPAAACSVVLLWQRSGIVRLVDRISLAQNEIASLNSTADKSRIRKKDPAGSSMNERPASAEVRTIDAPAPVQLSAREFLQLVPDEKGEPAAMVRLLPNLLHNLERYSADELFTLVNELNQLADEKEKAQSITGLLLILLTGVEPERTLAFVESQKGSGHPGTMLEVQTAAFSALARKDSARARRYLESSGWTDRLKEQADMALVREFARQDISAALEYMRDTNFDRQKAISVLAMASREPAVRENIREALASVEDSGMRDSLATSLVGATFTDAGFEGVSTLLETMEFSDAAARDKAILGAANLALSTQPRETVEWILREASPERRSEYLANGIMSWAYKDYNAAASWLEAQESSPERDTAISAFATTVVNLDQEAAAIWAGQIQEEALRTTARRRVFTEWNRRDPGAARAWLEQHDMSPSDWIPSGAAQD